MASNGYRSNELLSCSASNRGSDLRQSKLQRTSQFTVANKSPATNPDKEHQDQLKKPEASALDSSLTTFVNLENMIE